MNIFKAAKKMISFASPTSKEVRDSAQEKSRSDEDQHIKLLGDLNNKLEKLTSFWGNIKIGLVRGVATAIGATLVAAIALSIFAKVVNTIDDVPIIKDIIEETNVQESLNN